MQCPVCDHQAAVADFGDPLRCPDCGAYYEKAVLAKAHKEASAHRASPEPVIQSNKEVSKPAPSKKRTGIFTWLVLIGVVFFSVKACFSGGSSVPTKAGPAQPKCDSTMAHVMAGNFVKRELRAPSSAKFPYTSDREVQIQDLGNCRFSINSYVDSQNAFGAMIRSRFTVIMESSPDGKTWNAKNLVIN